MRYILSQLKAYYWMFTLTPDIWAEAMKDKLDQMRQHMEAMHNGLGSSNGRTPDSDSGNRGSSPRPRANADGSGS